MRTVRGLLASAVAKARRYLDRGAIFAAFFSWNIIGPMLQSFRLEAGRIVLYGWGEFLRAGGRGCDQLAGAAVHINAQIKLQLAIWVHRNTPDEVDSIYPYYLI